MALLVPPVEISAATGGLFARPPVSVGVPLAVRIVETDGVEVGFGLSVDPHGVSSVPVTMRSGSGTLAIGGSPRTIVPTCHALSPIRVVRPHGRGPGCRPCLQAGTSTRGRGRGVRCRLMARPHSFLFASSNHGETGKQLSPG